MASPRRVRGALLRLVRRRGVSIAIGIGLVVPAAWVEFGGHYSSWFVEGGALVVGATGLALLWTGVTGLSPDWVD
ncbi:MAG TPA: hypothetical protein VLV86_05430 [Vicinamibacterales bacterium]|nr:hypothetical protein [Vicinamibacterales bacterium]